MPRIFCSLLPKLLSFAPCSLVFFSHAPCSLYFWTPFFPLHKTPCRVSLILGWMSVSDGKKMVQCRVSERPPSWALTLYMHARLPYRTWPAFTILRMNSTILFWRDTLKYTLSDRLMWFSGKNHPRITLITCYSKILWVFLSTSMCKPMASWSHVESPLEEP